MQLNILMRKSIAFNTHHSPIVIAFLKSSPPWDECPKILGLAALKQNQNVLLPPEGITCFDRLSAGFQQSIILYYFSAACLISALPSSLSHPPRFIWLTLKALKKSICWHCFLSNADTTCMLLGKPTASFHKVAPSPSSQQWKFPKLLTFIARLILKHNTQPVLDILQKRIFLFNTNN